MTEEKSRSLELKRLQEEIATEKARVELTELKKNKGKPASKSFRRRLTEWMLGGGALLTIGGGGLDYIQQRSKGEIEISKTICDNAHRAVQDQTLNSSLTEEEQKAYARVQLKITQKCDRKAK